MTASGLLLNRRFSKWQQLLLRIFLAMFVQKTNLGYIKVIKIGEKNAATERGAESLTASEIASLMDKNAQAYYNIGEYWYIVV